MIKFNSKNTLLVSFKTVLSLILATSIALLPLFSNGTLDSNVEELGLSQPLVETEPLLGVKSVLPVLATEIITLPANSTIVLSQIDNNGTIQNVYYINEEAEPTGLFNENTKILFEDPTEYSSDNYITVKSGDITIAGIVGNGENTIYVEVLDGASLTVKGSTENEPLISSTYFTKIGTGTMTVDSVSGDNYSIELHPEYGNFSVYEGKMDITRVGLYAANGVFVTGDDSLNVVSEVSGRPGIKTLGNFHMRGNSTVTAKGPEIGIYVGYSNIWHTSNIYAEGGQYGFYAYNDQGNPSQLFNSKMTAIANNGSAYTHSAGVSFKSSVFIHNSELIGIAEDGEYGIEIISDSDYDGGNQVYFSDLTGEGKTAGIYIKQLYSDFNLMYSSVKGQQRSGSFSDKPRAGVLLEGISTKNFNVTEESSLIGTITDKSASAGVLSLGPVLSVSQLSSITGNAIYHDSDYGRGVASSSNIMIDGSSKIEEFYSETAIISPKQPLPYGAETSHSKFSWKTIVDSVTQEISVVGVTKNGLTLKDSTYENNITFGNKIDIELGGEYIVNYLLVKNVSEVIIQVSFDTQGGEGEFPPLNLEEGSLLGQLPIPIRSGFVFKGWYTLPNGMGKVASEDTLVYSSDTTLFANWEPQETSAPETSKPETSIPETSIPEISNPETSNPEISIPETSIPETSIPETSIPETSIPETSNPETSTPETSAPETSAPETSAPETSAPETSKTETSTNQEFHESSILNSNFVFLKDNNTSKDKASSKTERPDSTIKSNDIESSKSSENLVNKNSEIKQKDDSIDKLYESNSKIELPLTGSDTYSGFALISGILLFALLVLVVVKKTDK